MKMNASGADEPASAASPRSTASSSGCAAAREVLGPDRDVAVDFHGRFTLADARRVAPLLEPLHPFFLEEPVVPENSHLIALAGRGHVDPDRDRGARSTAGRSSCPCFEAGIAVAQPDLSHAGGISEVRRIAAARRGLRRAAGAALPARADRARRLPAGRLRHARTS